MSITNHNGTITLTSFAELGEALDPQTLPDSPAAAQDVEHSPEPSSPSNAVFDLANIMAQVATLSGGVEDARAREQATIELAHYEALLAERSDAEHALAEARRVRAAAQRNPLAGR